MSLSISPAVLSHMSAQPGSSLIPSSTLPVVRRGGKPATLAATVGLGAAVGKKGRKKKDPNEPQKPVSAYALFFRDTQAAIKGQNPNATFGEVSKIVASMWDSLGEEQKQVLELLLLTFTCISLGSLFVERDIEILWHSILGVQEKDGSGEKRISESTCSLPG